MFGGKEMTRLYVALTSDMGRTPSELLAPLRGLGVGIKIGLELFAGSGPGIVRELSAEGFPVFLDLKFHDIPHTVEGAVRAACALRPAILNVHASGGAAMMRAAAGAAAGTGVSVIAVTVLTSLDAPSLEGMGWSLGPAGSVLRLAGMARESGMDGVVCSPLEAASVRQAAGPGFFIITPGIRPAGAGAGDQARTATPAAAILNGADAVVVGRPISAAPDPRASATAILEELEEAVASRPGSV
ncbi:MAG TPA: orotidine-5'-phosphate decarboxylase [Candidatus Fermentibacter daniensis]|nr:orotidine-5'-phosphate decarboxylase [Candidatus Fermentibacter daniensis]HOR08158.1 orotidine-5'-phosphate decarboxylase [Candidatus Fermentibacter daniensis]HPK52219.1 orotidine-5'-phosphate decarboxylase [Candidatus Fermentibacter daniensis]